MCTYVYIEKKSTTDLKANEKSYFGIHFHSDV